MTFYWAHMSPERELRNIEAMAEAARHCGVRHVVWSTLEDTRRFVPLDDPRMPTLMGKYKVPHFDAKGEGDAFFRRLGVPTTWLATSFYWDNFLQPGMAPKPEPYGRLALSLPMGDKRLAGIAAEDIAKCAKGIFERGDELIGKTVGIAGEHLTGTQMAASFSRALGKPVIYRELEPAAFRSLGFPGAEDLGNMFQFYRDFEQAYCGARDVDVTRSLDPELQSFDQWLDRNKDRIPA